VILEIVSLDTKAPYTSSKRAATSPVINPHALSNRSTLMSRVGATSHQPARAQQQNDLIDPLQPPLPLADDLGPEQPVPIPRNLNLNRTDLSEHRPGPRAVARVLTVDDLVPLVPKALSHPRLQRGLQHRLHEPAKQTTQPHETNAQLPHPREQLLSNLLLINDLSRHRIKHLDDLAHNPSFQSNQPQIHHFPDSPADLSVAGVVWWGYWVSSVCWLRVLGFIGHGVIAFLLVLGVLKIPSERGQGCLVESGRPRGVRGCLSRR